VLLVEPEPPLPVEELLLWCFFLLLWVVLPAPLLPELLELPLP
jgi:hypothetical protein